MLNSFSHLVAGLVASHVVIGSFAKDFCVCGSGGSPCLKLLIDHNLNSCINAEGFSYTNTSMHSLKDIQLHIYVFLSSLVFHLVTLHEFF